MARYVASVDTLWGREPAFDFLDLMTFDVRPGSKTAGT